jgi:8-oxo-dGTP pyrophosphatase MutT (NUDIX family)
LLSGGIEAGESRLVALEREIREETGFTDFHIQGMLGGIVYAHYRKVATNEHFVKEIYPFLVTLTSLRHHPPALEDDEQFHNLFKDYDTVLRMMEHYERASGSTLEDHKEMLRRGKQYLLSGKGDIASIH